METQEVKGPPAEVHMTIEITRAATGKKESFQLVGYVNQDALKQEKK